MCDCNVYPSVLCEGIQICDMHTCVHTCIHPHTHLHSPSHTCGHTCFHSHTAVNTSAFTFTQLCTHLQPLLHICAHLHSSSHSCEYTCIHPCTCAHSHTPMHTHLQKCSYTGFTDPHFVRGHTRLCSQDHAVLWESFPIPVVPAHLLCSYMGQHTDAQITRVLAADPCCIEKRGAPWAPSPVGESPQLLQSGVVYHSQEWEGAGGPA